MGRNRVPTPILDAKGTYLKHPDRKRPDEPTTDRGLGSPPRHLSDEEKKVWKEIAARMLPGVVLESDRDAFEMMVKLTSKFRKGEFEHAASYTVLISLWSRFAMTPADRSRVSAEKKPESKLNRFLNNRPNNSYLNINQKAAMAPMRPTLLACHSRSDERLRATS